MYDLIHVLLPKEYDARRLQTELNNATSDRTRVADVDIQASRRGPELYIFTTRNAEAKQALYDVDLIENAAGFTDVEIEKLVNNAVSDGSRLVTATVVFHFDNPTLIIVTEAA